MSRTFVFVGIAAAAFVSAPNASAQVASAILRVGDAPSGTGVGVLITAINGCAANEVGGLGVRVTLSNTNHAVWGSPTSTAGSIVREEAVGIAGYNQTAFEVGFGYSNSGGVAYSPTCNQIAPPLSGLDTVWLDSMPIAIQNQAIPTLPGSTYRFASNPNMTAGGTIFWRSGINAGSDTGLFYGTGATVILKTGDPSPAPLTSVLGANAVDTDTRFSANGTYYISNITTTDAATADGHMVINYALMTDAGGNFMSEGSPISAAAGGAIGENYAFWDAIGINEAGTWFVTGDTSAVTTADAFVMKNGVILYREGSPVDGLTLFGNLPNSPSADMNEAGDLAFGWDTVGSITGIFLNGKVVLKEGDAVDFDGDGIVEPTSIFKAVPVNAALSVGNAEMFLTATVTVGGTDMTCVLKIALGTPTTSFCEGDAVGTTCLGCGNNGAPGKGCANFTFAGGGRLVASGNAGASIGTDTLVLTASDIPGPGLFFQADGLAASPITFGDGMLCASVNIVRMGVVFPSGGGVASYPGGLTPNPIHIAGGATAGQTKHYQCWYRDSGESSPGVSFCTPSTFNLTQGVSLTWTP